MTKQLKTGDDLPEVKPGVLRLYSSNDCPFVERCMLILHAKQIEYEVVDISTRYKLTWLVDKNPLEQVPILEKDGQILYESLAICRYLEAAYPDQTPLMPNDPFQQGKDDIVLSYIETKFLPAFRSKEKREIIECLERLEEELEKRRTKYFFGSVRPGFVDNMFWPLCTRLLASGLLGGENGVLGGPFKCLNKWMSWMYKDESVKITLLPDSTYQSFIEQLDGNNNTHDIHDDIETLNGKRNYYEYAHPSVY